MTDYSTTSEQSASTSGPSATDNTGPPLQTLAFAASSLSTCNIVGTLSFVPASHSAHQQLDAYISEQNIPRTECPLSWWTANRHRYPLIAEVARRLLVIPATAISTRRLYTEESEVMMDRRNAVSPEKADQVLFIMENL